MATSLASLKSMPPPAPEVISITDRAGIRSKSSFRHRLGAQGLVTSEDLLSLFVPGKFFCHPFPASPSHLAQRHPAYLLNRFSQAFWVILNPEATSDLLHAPPWCPTAGNHRHAMGQRLCHDHTEVFRI